MGERCRRCQCGVEAGVYGNRTDANSPENSGVSAPDAAKSAAVPETDPLAALLSNLTPEQRVRLAEMLLNDPTKHG